MTKQLKNEKKQYGIKIQKGCNFKSKYEFKIKSNDHKHIQLKLKNDKRKRRKNVSNDKYVNTHDSDGR